MSNEARRPKSATQRLRIIRYASSIFNKIKALDDKRLDHIRDTQRMEGRHSKEKSDAEEVCLLTVLNESASQKSFPESVPIRHLTSINFAACKEMLIRMRRKTSLLPALSSS
jgi:hypothetical protein